MNLIGIMQGRLLPPIDGEIQAFPGEQWRDEFQLAQECSLDFIEWIFEEKGWEKNAIMSDPAEIVKISRLCGIQVITLIADFFMDCPLLRVSKPEIDSRMKVFADLLERAGQLGIKVLNVPFVDNSEINSDEEREQVVRLMSRFLPAAEKMGIELALENSLNPENFQKFLVATSFDSQCLM